MLFIPSLFLNYATPITACPPYVDIIHHNYNAILRADDISHNVWEECSGGGTCDRSTGVCKCGSAYTGAACERMTCPGGPDSKVGMLCFFFLMHTVSILSILRQSK